MFSSSPRLDFLVFCFIRPGVPTAAPALTFRDLAQRYLEARPRTPRTRASLGYARNLRVVPRFGARPAAALTMAGLDEALVRLGRSLSTCNRIRAYCETSGQ